MDFRDLSCCHESSCILWPSHLFPKFHFPFWSTQFPVLIAVSIFGPTPSYIVEPWYDSCKTTKFQEKAATDVYGASRLEKRTSSKMELPMDPSVNWGERKTYFEGLNKQNAKCSKDIEH
jgi:hypothetical protein